MRLNLTASPVSDKQHALTGSRLVPAPESAFLPLRSVKDSVQEHDATPSRK
jgi:hypothetical protein